MKIFKRHKLLHKLLATNTDGPANCFVMYCHQIKIDDLFVLNTYKCKLCIKMMGYIIQEKLTETITTSTFYLK